MPVIQTVSGPIDAAGLGVTYLHEHLLTGPPALVADQDFTMDSREAASTELAFFYAAGGRAIVEMTTRDYGRDPAGLRSLSEQTGVRIIAVTGWQKDKLCRPWVAERSINDLADEMIRELGEGIEGTGVRAGLIKAASSFEKITPAEEKIFRAAARAQRETGALISTHTEAGTMGLEQIALLRSEGVDPARMLIGHADRRMDLEYHLAMLGAGATIGYDQVGKEKYYPDALRVEFLLKLAAAGFAERIALSCDLARRSNWPAYGGWGGPGLTFLLWRFVPWLRQRGMPAETIEAMLAQTPQRLLAFQPMS
jgi:predicted metal-dependent phosphotriesterase family hydrolase